MAMHAFAMHLVSSSDTEAAWMDTTGSFSGASLKSVITSKLGHSQTSSLNQFTVDHVLDRAKVSRVFDLHGIDETLEEIRKDHRDRKAAMQRERVVYDSEGDDDTDNEGHSETASIPLENSNSGVRCLVIDNITQPLSSMINQNQLQGQGLLVSLQRSMSFMARDLNMVVLILNDIPATFNRSPDVRHHVFQGSFASASWKLVHGPTYTYGADLHLLLSQHPHSPESLASEARRLPGFPRHCEQGPEDTIIEVLTDRGGERTGQWGAFKIVGTELIDAV